MNVRLGLRLTFVFVPTMRHEVVAVASETVSVSITIKAPPTPSSRCSSTPRNMPPL